MVGGRRQKDGEQGYIKKELAHSSSIQSHLAIIIPPGDYGEERRGEAECHSWPY